MSFSKLEQLPDELLVLIAAYLAEPEPDLPNQPYELYGPHAGFSDGKYQRVSPPYAMWSLCLTSKRLNGPAMKSLYNSVSINQYNVRMLLRTLHEKPEHALSIRNAHIRNTFGDYEHEDVASFYSSPRELLAIAKAVTRDLKLNERNFTHHSLRYQREYLPETAAMGLAILLLRGLQTLHLDMGLGRDDGNDRDEDRSDSVVLPMYIYDCLTSSTTALPGTWQARMVDTCQSLRFISLSGPHWRKATDEASQIPSIGVLAPVLRLKSLRSLEITRLHTEDLSDDDIVAGFDETSIAADHKLERLVIVECLLSRQHLAELIGTTPSLKSFVWLCPRQTDPWDQVEIWTRLADICQALHPHKTTLQNLVIEKFEGCCRILADWERLWTRCKHLPSPFGFVQIKDASSLRTCLTTPLDLSDFLSLESIRIKLFSLVEGLSFVDDVLQVNLHRSLPPTLRSIELVCEPKTTVGDREIDFCGSTNSILEVVRGIANEVASDHERHFARLQTICVTLVSDIIHIPWMRYPTVSRETLAKTVPHREGLWFKIKSKHRCWNYDSASAHQEVGTDEAT